MTRPIVLILILALATMTCSDKRAGSPNVDGSGNPDGTTAATGGSGAPGTGGTGVSTGGTGGAATGDAGTGGAGGRGTSAPDAGTCACTQEIPDAGAFGSALTSGWDCYCAALPSVCSRSIDPYIATVKTKYCYQIRQYASCALTRVFYRAAGVDPGGSNIFDTTTGQIVGVEYTSDTMIQCPTDPSSTSGVLSRSYKSGRRPGADCPETSCVGTCGVSFPSQTEQPCTP